MIDFREIVIWLFSCVPFGSIYIIMLRVFVSSSRSSHPSLPCLLQGTTFVSRKSPCACPTLRHDLFPRLHSSVTSSLIAFSTSLHPLSDLSSPMFFMFFAQSSTRCCRLASNAYFCFECIIARHAGNDCGRRGTQSQISGYDAPSPCASCLRKSVFCANWLRELLREFLARVAAPLCELLARDLAQGTFVLFLDT